MSTRAQIKIKDNPIHIYKHSDGYPEGVMPTLEPITTRWLNERGHSEEYLLANIMKAFARKEEEHRKEQLEEFTGLDSNMAEYYSKPALTGFGIGLQEHGDIEFLYEIDIENRKIIVNDMWYNSESYEVKIKEVE